MSKIRAAITGVGGYVPDYVLTNNELEKMVDTSDEWIVSRTGIRERRILKGENLGVSVMAVKAAKELLAKTNTDPKEIDAVIFATVTPDNIFPAAGNLVANAIGAVNAFSYDMAAACSGFLFALHAGAAYIESGRCKKILVIGGDRMSSIVDYTDRATCIIFGDGAACVLLEPTMEDVGVIDGVLRSDGSGFQYLHMKGGGSAMPASQETVANKSHYIYQEGAAVFKFAVTNMANAAEEIMRRNNLKGEEIAYLIAHQANKRIIDAAAHRIGVPDEKVLMNIDKYGNTTAGTIPLLLWDFEKQFKKGDKIVFAAFGGGFTWGALYLKWAYNS